MKTLARVEVESLVNIIGQFNHIINDLVFSIKLMMFCSIPVQNDVYLQKRSEILDELMDLATGYEDIVMLFVNQIASRIEEYENIHFKPIKIPSHEVLKNFMRIKNVKQKDLSHIVTQSVISEIINGHRAMTLKQVKAFAEYFNVPSSMFIGD